MVTHLLRYSRPVILLWVACLFASGQQSNWTPAYVFDQAKALLSRGDLTQAEHLTRQFLDRNSNSGTGHFLLGFILFREMQARAAQQITSERDVSDFATGPMAHASLAEYLTGSKYQKLGPFDLKIGALDYVLLGDYTNADKWLTSAVGLHPRDADAWYYLGRAKYFEGSFSDCIKAFDRCIRLNPNSARAKDGLGMAYEQLGRNNDAIQSFQSAIAAQAGSGDKDPQPLIDLGTLLVKQNRAEEALSTLRQAVARAPNEASAHEQLGRAYLQLGQLDKSQQQLQAAVTLEPQSPALHLLLGQIYRRLGMSEKARQEFAHSAELYGSHSTNDISR